MTPSQCRAARELLALTQAELAALADRGLSTVRDFETSRREVPAETVQAIADALTRAGVEFIKDGSNSGPAGPGVRLAKRTRSDR
jgi:transcriptional regulator with XRE-family HTH domain